MAPFEFDPLPPSPGYGAISGSTPGGQRTDGYGLNVANSSFADNGLIPDGAKVAFIQDNGTLSQVLSGFLPATKRPQNSLFDIGAYEFRP
jgi:hypothetical protein